MDLVICIEDNGIGLDTSAINESLRKNELDFVEKGNSIGLHNINARLKCYMAINMECIWKVCLEKGQKCL